MSTGMGVICDCGKICYKGNGATTAECEICDSCLKCCDEDNHEEDK